MEYIHRPVLLDECLTALNIKTDGIYVDMTLGRGGHSAEILKRLNGGKLICFDKDSEAIDACTEKFREYGDKVQLVKSDFRDAPDMLAQIGVCHLDGVLFDLGVSSPQLDDASRGFSYMQDAPLDMRMDKSSAFTASQLINNWSEDELVRIFREYGEERYSARIAHAIVGSRPIYTTFELVDVIRSAMPAAALREKQHPAKRCFQAIRIAVNDEMGALSDALESVTKLLNVGGKLAVITFHSLEDRIVKNFITKMSSGCTCPRDFPVCVCGADPALRPFPKKPILPSDDELTGNPRSRSAKLRVAEKLKQG